MKLLASKFTQMITIGLFVVMPNPIALSAEKNAGASTVWVEETFQDFSDGHFDSSGANLYVSVAGTIQIINRWDVNMDGYMDFYFGNTHDINHTQPVWYITTISPNQHH